MTGRTMAWDFRVVHLVGSRLPKPVTNGYTPIAATGTTAMKRFTFPPEDRADELILLHLSESEWQTIVQIYLSNQGWVDQHHEYDSRRVGFRRPTGPVIPRINTKGWPDLKVMRPPHFMFLELKTERGTVSDEQELIMKKLRNCRITALILRPRDWRILVKLANPTD